MTPTEHEGTVALEAAARTSWELRRAASEHGAPSWDDLDVAARHAYLNAHLPLVWAALEALPDRSPAALVEAARDYREHVHDEHPDITQGVCVPTADDIARYHAELVCKWLEQRADLMGADHG